MMKLVLNSKKWCGRLNLTLILLIICFLFLGCHSVLQADSDSPTPENKQIKTSEVKVDEQTNKTKIVDPDLEKNRRLWLESKIVNYDIVCSIDVSGITNPAKPVLIKVRDGKAISIEPISKSNTASVEMYKIFETVEKMFDKIEVESEKGAIVQVKYSKEFGYPEDIGINYASLGFNAWNGVEIKKFEIIDK